MLARITTLEHLPVFLSPASSLQLTSKRISPTPASSNFHMWEPAPRFTRPDGNYQTKMAYACNGFASPMLGCNFGNIHNTTYSYSAASGYHKLNGSVRSKNNFNGTDIISFWLCLPGHGSLEVDHISLQAGYPRVRAGKVKQPHFRLAFLSSSTFPHPPPPAHRNFAFGSWLFTP